MHHLPMPGGENGDADGSPAAAEGGWGRRDGLDHSTPGPRGGQQNGRGAYGNGEGGPAPVGAGRNGSGRVRDTSGTRPLLQILSRGTPPGRVGSRFSLWVVGTARASPPMASLFGGWGVGRGECTGGVHVSWALGLA
eukprot:gene9110-biopygen9229